MGVENKAGYATSAFSGMAGGSKGDGNKFQTGVVNDLNMAQIQQLFQLLNTGADGKLKKRPRYDK